MLAYLRTPLAEELVVALQGKTTFSDAHNGLFLAAPRRTGKTTFLRGDLQPALERAGVAVVYVDLWADVASDPGALIAKAIGQALQPHLSMVAKAAKKAGVDKVGLGRWVQVDLGKIGKVDGLTLAEALAALHQAAHKPVALIIDEAQHALTSEAGENAMSALKSARDQINSPGKVNLMLVMSGSDRDKLLRLVNTSSAPFYGSQIQRMPPLDIDFLEHIAKLIKAQRKDLRSVDTQALLKAFEAFGHRPQFFMEALGQVLSPLAELKGRFEDALLDAANQRQHDDEAQMESDYRSLKPAEQAVLWRMLELGSRFRPYDADALKFYREKTGQAVTSGQAQKALETLRQHLPSLVWKSARGEYAVEDAAMHRWFESRKIAGQWPPPERQRILTFEGQ